MILGLWLQRISNIILFDTLQSTVKTFTKKLFILFGFTGFKKEMITIEINQNLLNQAITLNEQTEDF